MMRNVPLRFSQMPTQGKADVSKSHVIFSVLLLVSDHHMFANVKIEFDNTYMLAIILVRQETDSLSRQHFVKIHKLFSRLFLQSSHPQTNMFVSTNRQTRLSCKAG